MNEQEAENMVKTFIHERLSEELAKHPTWTVEEMQNTARTLIDRAIEKLEDGGAELLPQFKILSTEVGDDGEFKARIELRGALAENYRRYLTNKPDRDGIR